MYWLLANRLDELADQVFGSIEKMLQSAPVVRLTAATGDVGRDVHNCGFESVEPVVEPAKVVVVDDGLAVGKLERGSPAPSFEGPLAVGGRAELPRPPRPGPLVDRAVTPAAAWTLR